MNVKSSIESLDKIYWILGEYVQSQPILAQCFISIPPEKSRKPKVFRGL